MSKKRAATTELNHDNWDQEDDEPEEMGTFSVASGENLAKRTIKVAKRRSAGTTSATTGLFSGFTGFKPQPPAATGTPTGSVVQKKPIFSTSTPLGPPQEPISKNGAPTIKRQKGGSDDAKQSTKPVIQSKDASGTTEQDPAFCSQLKALNEGVISWVQQHVRDNPYVDLSPVFKDYFTHIQKLEDKYKKQPAPKAETVQKQTPIFPSLSSAFGGSGAKDKTDEKEKIPTFQFGQKTENKAEEKDETPKSTAPLFQFGSQKDKPLFSFGDAKQESKGDEKPSEAPAPGFFFGNSAPKPGSGFSFGTSQGGGGSAPFTFGAVGAKTTNEGEGEEEPYVPPEVEVVEIEEKGAKYSTKCKLFYMKDGKYAEKGLGTLYIKPLEESKTQLLIRAGTSLGTILLNISLMSSIPMERAGKNNVSLFCLPNPPMDKSEAVPVSLLIRVKTGEDADKLLEKLKEHASSTDTA